MKKTLQFVLIATVFAAATLLADVLSGGSFSGIYIGSSAASNINSRVTEEGATRVTEEGATRVIEP
jgi:hypothetical protein